MANHAYLSLWFDSFTIERGVHHLEGALQLFPRSQARPDFHLRVRSLDAAQGVTLERELLTEPDEVGALCREFLHEDTAYEVAAHWELWRWQQEEPLKLLWTKDTLPVEVTLQGREFEEGAWKRTGQLWFRLGREHLFTGHAGVLAGAELNPEDFSNRAENQFAWALQEPDNRRDYLLRTRENVKVLHDFLRRLEQSLPVTQAKLWSEGEADFAAVTEKILAARA